MNIQFIMQYTDLFPVKITLLDVRQMLLLKCIGENRKPVVQVPWSEKILVQV